MAMRAVRNKSQIETDGADVHREQPRPVPEFEDDIYKQFVYLMPSSLQQEIIDALIICSPKDIEAAKNFENHLANDICYKFGEKLVNPKVQLLDEITDEIEQIFERSIYTFLFLTQSFLEDQWTLMLSHACLKQMLSDPSKRWSLIPVHTNPTKIRNYRMPLLLQPLKPIEFIRGDQFYKDSMVKMFVSKADERERINRKRREYYYQHEETLIKGREDEELRKSATNIQGQQIKPKVSQSYSKVETDSPSSQRLSSNVLQRSQNKRDNDVIVFDSSCKSSDSNNLSNFEHLTSSIDQNSSSVEQSGSNDISSMRGNVGSSNFSNPSLHYDDPSKTVEIEDNLRSQTLTDATCAKEVHYYYHNYYYTVKQADNVIIGNSAQMTINNEERKSCSHCGTNDHRPPSNVQCARDNSDDSDDQRRASIETEGFPDLIDRFSGASTED